MANYKQKASVIKAIQWDGKKNTLDAIIDLLSQNSTSPELFVSYTQDGYGYIQLISRSETLKLQDYIILKDGSVLIISKTDFEGSYEQV